MTNESSSPTSENFIPSTGDFSLRQNGLSGDDTGENFYTHCQKSGEDIRENFNPRRQKSGNDTEVKCVERHKSANEIIQEKSGRISPHYDDEKRCDKKGERRS